MEESLETSGRGVDLRALIYRVRGEQVMLDRDLAALYGVETKALNQAVTRNIDRFPERYSFKLTPEEAEEIRSQIVTLSDEPKINTWWRHPPRVFTEQGVAMLSAVLRSAKAVEVSIGIMDAFVEMRKLLLDRANILQRMTQLEERQLKHELISDERFERVFGYLEEGRPIAQRIFYEGETFDALSLLVDIVRQAKEEILLIDGYVDVETLDVLSKKRTGVKCTVVTRSKCALSERDVRVFEQQHGALSVVRTDAFHDRFLILDSAKAYHVGASIKDAGKRAFAVSRIEDPEIVEGLLSRIVLLPTNRPGTPRSVKDKSRMPH